MNIYAISDLHISLDGSKPMDIFGHNWYDHLSKLSKNWKEKIDVNDIVLLPGDLSWATTLEDAKIDLSFLSDLPGKKIIIKGNHDYWWNSYSKVKSILPNGVFPIQNNAVKIGDYIFCGTRGWGLPELGEREFESDAKIVRREAIRLQLSLAKASELRKKNEKIYVLMHYPPFNSARQSSVFTSLLKDSFVEAVVYGHLHGDISCTNLFTLKDKVKYYLVSTDLVNHNPVLIS